MDKEGKYWTEREILDREGKYRTEGVNIGHRGNYLKSSLVDCLDINSEQYRSERIIVVLKNCFGNTRTQKLTINLSGSNTKAEYTTDILN